ncbi:peptidoglycan bridge formation glycyltransferase FemA/FemB family protein [Candidatus Saccharibacteria bacterium]|nr:peptidoglycan bridge formation glycyltransferase FemA/FemB family protein [Candidatus Saccharibacteria bacterium]
MRSTNKVIPGETVLLDLTKNESDLLADMAKKTRQYIRKSSADVEIKPVRSAEDLEKCLDIYRQTSKRAGFNVHSNEYYLDVKRLMGDYSPIFAAYVDDEPVSFLWLAISGETAYELYGGMNERGQELRANYALKWYAIRKVKEWGLRRYDFGGVVEGGVATFKQGWSADTTLFAGSFDRPLSPVYTLWSKGLPFAKRTAQRLRRKR